MTWVLLLGILAPLKGQSYGQPTEVATSHLRTLVQEEWSLFNPDRVRSLLKSPLRTFTCVPQHPWVKECLGLSTDRSECGDDEFVFTGPLRSALLLKHFSLTTCVESVEDAERLLDVWKTIADPPVDATLVVETSGSKLPSRRYEWEADGVKVGLMLEARPMASIWVVRVHLGE
jgi:hypothetical protein